MTASNVPDLGKQALSVLQHTLGLDSWGKSKSPSQPDGYRNHFVAEEGHHEWGILMLLVQHGLMDQHAPFALSGGSPWFSVTGAGRAYVAQYSPKPPKLTKAQERYQRFLDLSDVMPDLTFKQFVTRRLYLTTEERDAWEHKQLLKRLDLQAEEERKRRQLKADLDVELNKWKEKYGYPSAKDTGSTGSGTPTP